MNSTIVPRKIEIGGKGQVKKLTLGGSSPILLQTMWKESLLGADLNYIAKSLNEFEQLGCDLVRFAVPDMDSAEQFVKLTRLTPMPLVADIHFDYKLALRCMDGDTAKIRINPGNIGSKERTQAVIQKAKDTGTVIRIGVNSGSLPSALKKQIEEMKVKQNLSMDKKAFEDEISALRAGALTEAAAQELEIFEKANFKNAVVSMKASNVWETVRANEIFAKKFDNPLHLGVTEAGPLIQGIVKSTIAFYRLLEQNIGSTIRVSLSDSCENEIIAGREILAECGKRQGGIRLVSCPRCGRKGFDVQGFVKRWQTKLLSEKKDISIAVMGCVVNGPGEGKHADLGVTGAEDSVIIFKHGEIIKRLDLKNLTEEEKIEAVDKAFNEELQSL
ncbi:(E)-4-hydroxy-3-methylbut-2-enyl-diphosphate synthase [Treponema sp. OMZ 799]|uniref:(E)-4-hydroxy-3-methylbut-2-enyl-diphosphate synthase n=1 Tax=Treponema sp. OMZ 799 TaxID=2563668 RepID=UPI0020A2ACA6|nr:(E)-4-hydroxy-3-methylbut-2-enyl-diphosphate synthase [Treponema sp. OMZ 799]UTC77663.1 (E)-4-hydroxy-3-methylbut-2-enyl-diphosphate synthase [Treponema sp. OMZ 799]